MFCEIINPKQFDLPLHGEKALRAIFDGYQRVIIQDSFTDVGYSNSWVYRVELVDKDNHPGLPIVVKIGPVNLVEREYEAFHRYVKNQHWPSVADLYGEPARLHEYDIAAICYPLVGGGIFNISSLREYSLNDQTTPDDLTFVLNERLFSIVRNRLRFVEVEHRIPLSRSYDAVLPVNLRIEYRAWATSEQLTPLSPDTAFRVVQLGEEVQVSDFIVREIDTRNHHLTLDLPPNHISVAYRIRITKVPQVQSFSVGSKIEPMVGVIIATRTGRLHQELQAVMPADFSPTDEHILLTDRVTVTNPLPALPNILSSPRSLRVMTIHGDFNLENIMIDWQVRDIRLIDFAEARRDHVLHDFLRLETEIITKLLPEHLSKIDATTNIAGLVYSFFHRLHYATFQFPPTKRIESPHPDLVKPFTMLTCVRRTARQYALFRAEEYDEYYACLTIYLVAALKFKNLDSLLYAKRIAFWSAAIVYHLMRYPASVLLPTPEQVQAHLDRLRQQIDIKRWAAKKTVLGLKAGHDTYLEEQVRLLLTPQDLPHAPPANAEPINLIELLQQSQRIVILGASGTGKTTILERRMWEILDQQTDNDHIPILVRLLNWEGDLLGRLTEELVISNQLVLDKVMLATWLDSEQVTFTFMFDGLNELPGQYRATFVEQLANLMNNPANHRHRYIITSRMHDELWHKLRQRVTDLQIGVVQPINTDQIQEYLQSHIGPVRWKQVWNQMDSRLRALTHRPLMLWLLKEIAQHNGGTTLPRNRWELFDKFVQYTLRRDKLNGTAKTSVLQKRRALIHLAWEMQLKHRLTIPFFEAVQLVAKHTGLSEPEADRLLKDIRSSGLLEGENQLNFIHLALQEHFVADTLRKRIEEASQSSEKLPIKIKDFFMYDEIDMWAHDDWWAEPFIHTAGLMPEPTWLIKRLADRTKPWLAYWCVEEGQQVDSDTRQYVEERSISKLLSLDNRTRLEAVEGLITHANERISSHLAPLLDDADPNIGKRVYDTFINASDKFKISVEPFLQVLETTKVKKVRRWAANITAKHDAATAAPALIQLLVHEDDSLGEIAYRALRHLPNLPTHNLLATAEYWLADLQATSAGWLSSLLAERPEPEITEHLLQQANHEQIPVRREVTNLLIKRLNGPAKDDSQIVRTLVERLSDSDEQISQTVYDNLATRTDLPSDMLQEIFADHDGPVRHHIAQMLLQTGNPEVIASLIPTLDDDNQALTRGTFEQLRQYRNLPLTPLLKLLQSERAHVRRWGAILLGPSDHEQAAQALVPLLQDENESVSAAVYSILMSHQHLPQPPLLELANKPNNDVRDKIITLLIQSNSTLHYKPSFIYIPDGFFWMGSNVTRRKREKPQHELYLTHYWLSRQPVTIAQYNDYLRSIGRTPIATEQPDLPMTNLDWFAALDYCRWFSQITGLPVTLPSEAQWEKAARGRDKRIFPWGSEWENQTPRCNTKEGRYGTTTPVSQFSPLGDSPFGCQDMVGNAWEWTLSEFQPYPYSETDGREEIDGDPQRRLIVRGGSFNTDATIARVTTRAWRYPTSQGVDVGFRLVIKF